MHVSVLGFGGAEIGYQALGARDARRLLEQALDAGLNVIDTAACYGDGETLVGEVAQRRSEFLLFTKCGHAAGLGTPDWDPRTLAASIERSLRRLGTDHVDLLQLHSCSEEVLRRGDALAVLERARADGKARYIGYSGDGAAARYAVESGFFDALQTSVNIADQEAITLTLPAAARKGMGIIAKRPIANACWRHADTAPEPYHRPYWERLRALNFPFLHGNMDAAVATALRFTLSVPGVHTAIVGTAKPDRWQQNATLVAAGQLPADVYGAIRARWQAVAPPDWYGQR